MRVLLTGGGTAGHVFPCIAVAQALRAEAGETELLFVASRHGLDAEALTRYKLPYEMISARPFPYGVSWRLLPGLWGMARGGWQTRGILRRFRPDVVMTSGGFVSAAVVPVAARYGLPIVSHVSDAQPDRTNRLLRRWATVVTLAHEQSRAWCAGHDCRVVGQPIRAEFFATTREAGAAALGLDPGRPTLLVTGGSQGARTLNDAVQDALPELLSHPELQVAHVTGARDHERVLAWAEENGFLSAPRYQVWPWVDMPPALAAADLVLTRAGSSALAEACASRGALIVVPYPFAGGHQAQNAAELERVGAAVVIRNDDFTGAVLAQAVQELLADRAKRAAMAAAAGALAQPQAAQEIAGILRGLAGQDVKPPAHRRTGTSVP